jgi:hypothetical protein
MAYDLQSCRALGLEPEPVTVLSLLAEIRDELHSVAAIVNVK